MKHAPSTTPESKNVLPSEAEVMAEAIEAREALSDEVLTSFKEVLDMFPDLFKDLNNRLQRVLKEKEKGKLPGEELQRIIKNFRIRARTIPKEKQQILFKTLKEKGIAHIFTKGPSLPSQEKDSATDEKKREDSKETLEASQEKASSFLKELQSQLPALKELLHTLKEGNEKALEEIQKNPAYQKLMKELEAYYPELSEDPVKLLEQAIKDIEAGKAMEISAKAEKTLTPEKALEQGSLLLTNEGILKSLKAAGINLESITTEGKIDEAKLIEAVKGKIIAELGNIWDSVAKLYSQKESTNPAIERMKQSPVHLELFGGKISKQAQTLAQALGLGAFFEAAKQSAAKAIKEGKSKDAWVAEIAGSNLEQALKRSLKGLSGKTPEQITAENLQYFTPERVKSLIESIPDDEMNNPFAKEYISLVKEGAINKSFEEFLAEKEASLSGIQKFFYMIQKLFRLLRKLFKEFRGDTSPDSEATKKKAEIIRNISKSFEQKRFAQKFDRIFKNDTLRIKEVKRYKDFEEKTKGWEVSERSEVLQYLMRLAKGKDALSKALRDKNLSLNTFRNIIRFSHNYPNLSLEVEANEEGNFLVVKKEGKVLQKTEKIPVDYITDEKISKLLLEADREESRRAEVEMTSQKAEKNSKEKGKEGKTSQKVEILLPKGEKVDEAFLEKTEAFLQKYPEGKVLFDKEIPKARLEALMKIYEKGKEDKWIQLDANGVTFDLDDWSWNSEVDGTWDNRSYSYEEIARGEDPVDKILSYLEKRLGVKSKKKSKEA